MLKTELAILGLLSEKPMHGYEIKQTAKDRWMEIWALISIPSIYNTLNRLTEKNYLEVSKEKIGKAPVRNVYSLSDKGKQYLVKLVEQGLKSANTKKIEDLPFWLAVAFIHFADSESATAALHGRITCLKESCEILKKEHQGEWNEIPFSWQTIIISGIEHMELEMKRIRYMIEHLKKSEKDKDTQACYKEIVKVWQD